jgi:ABC-type transport system involved in multi-copper enzyme maturation permease subunit
MKLILLIARKELVSNIFSFRLLVGLVVCLTLFISSGHVLTKDYEKRLRIYNSAKTEHRNELEEVKVYSQLKVNLDRAPEPLSIFCLGMEKRLGNTVTVSYEDVPTEAKILGGDNPLLHIFSPIDTVFIVQLVLSLFVILIAYDVISGEREDGTLALLMSNPISKFHVLIGKYLGGMGSILLPLGMGWVAVVAVMSFSPMIELGWADLGRIGLLFIVSALYLSTFFLLSTLLSVRCARSDTALILSLFLWIGLVLVIPNGAAYLAEQIQPIESRAKVDAERDSIMKEFQRKIRDYGEEHRSGSYIAVGKYVVSGMYPFAFRVLTGSREAMLWYLDGARFYIPLRIEYAERVGRLYRGYYRSLKKQTVLAENLSRLSPGWVYYNVSAILAGTDLGGYERFIKLAGDYRRELMEYMRERGAFSTIRWFTRVNLDELPSQAEASYIWRRYDLDASFDRLFNGPPLSAEEKRRFDEGWKAFSNAREAVLKRLKLKSWDEVGALDLSDMPVFTFERGNTISAVGQALPDLAILISLNAFLFLGSAAVFLKGEVM